MELKIERWEQLRRSILRGTVKGDEQVDLLKILESNKPRKSLATAIHEAKQLNGTLENKFEDFPIGTKVRVIGQMVDFYSFGDQPTGKVIRNDKRYLAIIVQFDEPRKYEGGYTKTDHGFNPSDLKILEGRIGWRRRLRTLLRGKVRATT